MERVPSADEIRALRLRLGLTQQQAADRLRVHRVTWVRWETGVDQPSQQSSWLLRLLRDGLLPD